jgi:hypothetical protein
MEVIAEWHGILPGPGGGLQLDYRNLSENALHRQPTSPTGANLLDLARAEPAFVVGPGTGGSKRGIKGQEDAKTKDRSGRPEK